MRLRPLAAVTTAAAATMLVLGAAPAGAATPVVLSAGHVDVVDVEYEAGALEIVVHDEENDVEYETSDVLLRALRGAKTTVPSDPAYAFLGAPGSAVWILPQIQDPALLWAGLSTEEIGTGVLTNNAVTLKLKRVCGPGKVSVFGTSPFGAPSVIYNSGDGLPDSRVLTAGAHEHYNWGFTKSGRYTLTFEATAKVAATGRTVTSGPVDVAFDVVR